MGTAFELIGIPAVVLSPAHRLLVANAPMIPYIPAVIESGPDRVRFLDRTADKQLAKVLAMSEASLPDRFSSAIPVRASKLDRLFLAHFVREGTSSDSGSPTASVLILTTVAEVAPAPRETLCALFGLTPAEARVAHALGRGARIEDMAREFGSSLGTIRTQLKAVFAKTGAHSQAQLMSVLCSLTSWPAAWSEGCSGFRLSSASDRSLRTRGEGSRPSQPGPAWTARRKGPG